MGALEKAQVTTNRVRLRLMEESQSGTGVSLNHCSPVKAGRGSKKKWKNPKRDESKTTRDAGKGTMNEPAEKGTSDQSTKKTPERPDKRTTLESSKRGRGGEAKIRGGNRALKSR